jgi:hypothetical protein
METRLRFSFLLLFGLLSLGAAESRRLAIVWRDGTRTEMEVEGDTHAYGPEAPVVRVEHGKHPFSFFLRDVRDAWPIYIPAYGVAVTSADDRRTFEQIAADIRSRGLKKETDQIEAAPEATFESEAAATREMKVPTWLGVSRDMRIFVIGERLDNIYPMLHGENLKLPETGGKAAAYQLMMGRGWGPADLLRRSLDEGVLPVLKGYQRDGEIDYELTAFAGFEDRPLSATHLRGTHYLVADGHGYGHMLTPEQKAEYERQLPSELNREPETVLFLRMRAVNLGRTPHYAFFRSPVPTSVRDTRFDSSEGLTAYASGRVFSAARLNREPLRREEVAFVLAPGETVTLDIAMPHTPLSRERAVRLWDASFEDRLEACRVFWRQKLKQAASIQVPEERLNRMIRAGLLHLDLINYGIEPSGPLTPAIGIYTAIGSESSPIIQFFDSMGLHRTAERALDFFLAKQHANGFMQNFGGYMLETGAVLWTMGEHYRYTRDEAWVRRVSPNVVRAADYLLGWRARNQRPELRGKGYGMLDGKTADPEDPFRSFMLNGYAAVGLKRAAEMLRGVDAAQAARFDAEAAALREDIRGALADEFARGPVIPLGDGTWTPTAPPWAGYRGPVMLYTDGGKWFSHGAMSTRDSLLGPLYLVLQEVLSPTETMTTFLLQMHEELMTQRNTAFSQPYYSRHPLVHLMRGEVKPFLKTYFNAVSALADRETFTFYEHFYGASSHKTHEEAWFLMETRWMLYREVGEELDVLGGVPSEWLKVGRSIGLRNVASYFGHFSFNAQAEGEDRIVLDIEAPQRTPSAITVRLPHPGGKKPFHVEGGVYDAASDRVRIARPSGKVRLVVEFR